MTESFMPEGYYLDSTKNIEYTSSLDGLKKAMEQGAVLEAVVEMCDYAHNLWVELGEIKGMIPRSEVLMSLEGESTREIAVITRVGKAVCFKVVEIKETENGCCAILSRRLAQEQCYNAYIKMLRSGDIIDAKITHSEPFGSFCDIGRGIISLLPIDCISVSRINHPTERFFTGQYIKAIVKKTTRHDGRILLTHKELLGTWEQNARLFNRGETVSGIVRSVESYGIFIELTPNLAGLAEWREGITPGKSVAVFIKSIIPEKMKIKLAAVDSCQANATPKRESLYMPFENGEGDEIHIDRWRYSPDGCEKAIETIFDDSP